jgi:nucleotide-binding universal stress UspA family protein
MSSYKKIMVGTDGSDTSMLAVSRAAAIAADSNASLLIVTAYQPADAAEVKVAAEALKQDVFQVIGSAPAESALRTAESRAIAVGATSVETLSVQGSAVAVLDRAVADSGADLLVVGSVGLNTFTGRILGSVPQSVARHANVDVLIVHTA